MKEIALELIRFYQVAISPFRSSSCRYMPSCSQHGYEAIGKYGLLNGGWLTAKGICICHPLAKGDIDPVP